MPWSRCDAAIAVPSDCGHRRATASHRSAAPAGMRNQVLPQHVARRQPVRGVACGVGEARPPGNGRVHELITAYAPPAFQRTSHRPPRVVNCRHELDSIRARQGWLGEVVQGRGAGRLASRGLRELTYAGLGIPAGPRTGRGVPPAACRRGPARRARGDDSVPARVRAAARAPGCHRGRGGPGRPARSCRKHDDGSCHHRVGVARDLPGAGLPAPSQHRGRRPPGPGGWRRGGHLVNSRRPRRPPRLLSSVPQPPTESYESHPLRSAGSGVRRLRLACLCLLWRPATAVAVVTSLAHQRYWRCCASRRRWRKSPGRVTTWTPMRWSWSARDAQVRAPGRNGAAASGSLRHRMSCGFG